MKNEIEVAKLVHHYVRGGLSDEDQDKLFEYLDEDPGLLNYILIDNMIYETGLQRKNMPFF
ncbi:MAG: hypothetical protein JJU13_12480 [Balneolaceae bacterium]|nr:hypothetical protein [Balneolaceae bacterium]